MVFLFLSLSVASFYQQKTKLRIKLCFRIMESQLSDRSARLELLHTERAQQWGTAWGTQQCSCRRLCYTAASISIDTKSHV